jgi:hypothetical protein
MDVDSDLIRQMLRRTAEELVDDAAALEAELRSSSMTPEVEQLWFGEQRQGRIDFFRWAAERMRMSAAG